MSTYKTKVKAKKPRVRDAIKAIQDIPPAGKNLKRKKLFVESSDSKKNPTSRAPESDGDLPAPPKRVVRPALINDSAPKERAPPKRVERPALIDEGNDSAPKERAKKNKGKGRERREEIQEPDNKGKAKKGADQGGKVLKPKRSVLSHLIRFHHVFTFIERNHTLLLLS